MCLECINDLVSNIQVILNMEQLDTESPKLLVTLLD